MSEDYVKHVKQRYEETVRRTAQSLRDLADDFEKRALDLDINGRVKVTRTTAASRAFHALTWGLANASPERLITDAAEADEAERKEEK